MMKRIKLKILVEMGKNVIKFILIFAIVGGCKSQVPSKDYSKNDLYKIIEKESYKSNSLYFKTISYEKLLYPESFSFKHINEYNVKYNSIVEENRYVNFDTIFNTAQKRQINKNFRDLQSKRLRKKKFSHPEIISNISNKSYGIKREGAERVSFPFIISSKNGSNYGFIYRQSSVDGTIYIYKKINDCWKEFCKVEIWVN